MLLATAYSITRYLIRSLQSHYNTIIRRLLHKVLENISTLEFIVYDHSEDWEIAHLIPGARRALSRECGRDP